MSVEVGRFTPFYQLGFIADTKPANPGFKFLHIAEDDSWYSWDGVAWQTSDFASVLNIPTNDQKAALDGAASPDAMNVFATMDDVSAVGVETMSGGDLSGDLPAPVVESIHGGSVLDTSVTHGLAFYGESPVEAAARPAIPTQAVTVSVTDFNDLRDHLIALGLILDGD